VLITLLRSIVNIDPMLDAAPRAGRRYDYP
jgi:hypothetical protein